MGADARRALDGMLEWAAGHGAPLGAKEIERLESYLEALARWGRAHDLVADPRYEVVAREHLTDALALAPLVPRGSRCVDVGSGAGLPGLILAVVREDTSWELWEPREKRAAFLRAAAAQMGLRETVVARRRAERPRRALGHPPAREDRPRFNFAVSRAVFPPDEWIAIGATLVTRDGVVSLLLAGDDARAEPHGISMPPTLTETSAIAYQLPDGRIRRIVLFSRGEDED